MPDNLLIMQQLTKRTSLSRRTIYRHIADGLFPKPLRIGPKRVAWAESDIDQWQQTKRSPDSG